MKRIYLILTKSPTLLSRSIAWLTGEQYTHSSISFSDTIQPMYSSGRKYAFISFPAGLKEEPLDKSFYKYFSNSAMGIYCLDVDDKVYDQAYNYVTTMVEKKYPFNALGLILCWLKIDHPRKNHYFCSEFVANALAAGGIDILKKPNLYHPSDFLKIKGLKCLYIGKVKDAINKHFQ
ncbi:MAG: hypothetical protein Q4C64_01720 [Erysipelotrichia bacterium]|nr:hypothetical protein [Erysipelotrichia bacterium]